MDVERHSPRECPTELDFWRYCHAKRFLERWIGDASFRARVPCTPRETFADYGLKVDPDEVREVWDPKLSASGSGEQALLGEPSDTLRAHRGYLRQLLAWREELRRDASPTHPRWRAWRARQMARARTELGAPVADAMVFATGCYELSQGCSVGCWFCGLDAPRLSNHFAYTPESSALFRELLEVMKAFCGPSSFEANFLYWATDPFDNPDYELFARDYCAVTGSAPLVTTALPLRDIERTRRWLARRTSRGARVDRFSVLSLRMLDRIHQTFTAEDLANVELVLQNKESTGVKANSGRYRGRSQAARQRSGLEAGPPGEDAAAHCASTIACVTGMLFNMVDRSMRLVTPCAASERSPLGYRTLAVATFDAAGELHDAIARMIDEHMGPVPEHREVRFREDLVYEPIPAGFRLRARYGGSEFGHPGGSAYWAELGALVAVGESEPAAIAERLWAKHGVFPGDTRAVIDGLFEKGFLCEAEGLTPAAVGQA